MTRDPARARAIAAIHAEAKRIGLDDGSRRDLIQSVTGKRSAADLTAVQAAAVVRRMKALGGGRPLSACADGKYGPVLQALWRSAYHLGVVRDADDRALIAFVRRQLGVDHTRFLTEATEARKAIEAIKAMCARGGVTWPKSARGDIVHQKRAVVDAILARLAGRGVQVEAPSLDGLDGAALDRLQQRFGKRLRAALGLDATP